MIYNSRSEFQNICRINARHRSVNGKKYTRCHNAFWLLMYPNDKAISDNISAYGYWEPWDAMAMSNLIDDHKDWTFIDVGANIGYYSMLAAHLGVKVHAFECNPNMIPYIEDSAKDNKFDIHIHEVALGHEDGEARLSINSENYGGASLYKQPKEDDSIEVKVTTLDKEMKDLDSPFIIKVDVEGYERHVWWGSQELREKHNNIWFVEWFNNRWSTSDARAFLGEVSDTHKISTTVHSGHIEASSIDKILAMPFATLVFTKNI